MNLQPNQHLSHEQLCDILLGSHLPEPSLKHHTAPSAILMAIAEAHQEHLRDCLICASELDLMRSSVEEFHDASTALADRELARRPIRPRFAPIYSAHSRRQVMPLFFLATAALILAAVIPLGLLNPKLNPLRKNHPVSNQSAINSSASDSDSDAALLDGIDEDLSAAVPSPMQPLVGPSATTLPEPDSSDIQNQDLRTN
jgi:hypothetical protein